MRAHRVERYDADRLPWLPLDLRSWLPDYDPRRLPMTWAMLVIRGKAEGTMIADREAARYGVYVALRTRDRSFRIWRAIARSDG
jgi:hypothetical protein